MANLSNINGKFVVEQTTGFVGIGTTDPAFLIEAAGTNAELALNASSIYRVRSTAGDEFIITKNGVGDRLTISGGGDATFSGNITLNEDLNFSTNGFADISNTGTGAMRFKPSSQTLALTLTGANATFAGSATIETGINLESGVLVIKNATGDANGLRIFQDSSDASKIYNNYNGTLQLGVGNTTAITIDSSENATFAGQIGLGGTGIYTNSASLNIDGLGLAIKNDTAGSSNNWSLIKNTATLSESNIVFISGAGTAVTINHDKSAIFEGAVTVSDDFTLDNSSPEMYFKTGASHYNWMIAAQENVDTALEFTPANAVGASGTYDTPALTLYANRNAVFAGELTTNGDLLQVSGAHPELKLNDSDDSNYSLVSYSDGDLLISTNHGNEAGAADTIRFANNGGSERMRIISSGNVGIGTTSPSANLEVAGDVLVASGEYISWGGVGETSIEGSTVSTKLQFRTGSADRMIINNTGVGIGTTSPDGKLEVAGGTTLGLRITNAGDSSAYDQTRITYSGYNSGSPEMVFMPLTTPGSGTVNTFFRFKNSNGSNADNNIANVSIDGKLGVGTTAPDHILCIEDSEPTLRIFDTDNTLNQEQTIAFGTEPGDRTQAEIASINTNTGNASGALSFKTNSGSSLSERVRITQDGNVGMGTTSPDSKLQIMNNDGSSYRFGYGGSSDVYFDADTIYIRTDNGGANTATFTTTGLGIGTTSPNPFSWGNKHLTCLAAGTNQYFGLDIVGSGSGAGAIIFGGGSGSGTATNIARAQISALDGSDLAFYTNGNNSGSSFSERIRIKSGGNVGIGTTTPQTTLEVDGASSALNAHFGQGQDNSSGVFGGISLGYAEANTSYRKVGLVAKALADGAARQDFCILVDTVSDSGSAALADTKFKIDGLTGDTTITGTVTATADVVAYSDKKLKKNIKTLDGSKVYDMRGVSFTRKDNGNESSGVIAQEIQKIAPELVNETDGTLGVAYGNLTGYLIEAIKELKAEIEELKKQIK